MASAEAEKVRAELFAQPDKSSLTLEQRRADWAAEAAKKALPEGTEVRAEELGGVFCEWVTHREAQGTGVFLLLHGGGFVNGGRVTHHSLAAQISASTGLPVVLPDYSLAPEQPYPTAVKEAVAVFGALLAAGYAAEQIVVGGDSAGGGLSLQMLLALKEAGAPLPAAGVLLSPWTDLTQSGASYDSRKELDPIIDRTG